MDHGMDAAEPPDDASTVVSGPSHGDSGQPVPDPVSSISDKPHLASVESLWSRPARVVAIAVILLAMLIYGLFGTVLARNVTFNISHSIDPGAKSPIPRYSRETIASIWRTMWDKAPDFGSVDATRLILLVATVAFFAAFAAIIMLVFVPARQEWSASLGERQDPERPAGD